MPELPEEMRIFQKQLQLRNSIMELRKLRDEFSQYKDMLTRDFESSCDDGMSDEWESLFSQIEEDDFMVKQKLSDASLEYHSAFHPRWGQMFVVRSMHLICSQCCHLSSFSSFRVLFHSTGWLSRLSFRLFCGE